jgi:hypothetical protein
MFLIYRIVISIFKKHILHFNGVLIFLPLLLKLQVSYDCEILIVVLKCAYLDLVYGKVLVKYSTGLSESLTLLALSG